LTSCHPKLSSSVYEESLSLIPGGVNSPVRAFQEIGIPPIIARHGKGDLLVDIDDRVYVDYCMSWGALLLGHADPFVVRAVQEQMSRGSSFGLLTELEVALAKTISTSMPSIEKIRFVSSGTEATMSALRVARGYTKRSLFVKFVGNYHGHADPFLVRAGSGVLLLPQATSLGVPQESIQHTVCLPYNDPQSVKDLFSTRKDIAAAIVEPIATNMGLVPGTREFLETLREETRKTGTLLIFDEVVTGFRMGLGGAQGLFGITPDLTCLGKIIGGGLPCAAFGGRQEVMDLLAPLGGVYQAGTLSGNPLAMAAGLATLSQLQQEGIYVSLQKKTEDLLTPIHKLLSEQEGVTLQQIESCFTLFFAKQERFQAFYRFLLARGIYFPPSQWETCFVSLAHTQESLAKTSQAMMDFFHS